MPFGFFKSQQHIDNTSIIVPIKEVHIQDHDETSEEYSKTNEEYSEFDEEYYKLKVSNVLMSASKLYCTYKKIIKEEIKNEMIIYNNGNVKNNHDIYINNGI